MTGLATVKAPTSAAPSGASAQSGLLQRKCACGGVPGVDGECARCRGKRLTASRRASNPRRPGVRARLTVNTPGDRYEREAEQVSELVTRVPDGTKLVHPPRPIVQARGAEDGASAIDADIEEGIRSSRGKGRPLPTSVREFFEPRFVYDFGRVRIHADDYAGRTAKAIGADAFTFGSDIFFGAGRYVPNSPAGQRLLAHELTHVVQQVPHVARQEGGCVITPGTFREGEGYVYKEKNWYLVIGTWRKGDTTEGFWRRIFDLWIPWRFGKVTPDTRKRMLETVMTAETRVGIPSPEAGCQYPTLVGWELIGTLDRMAGRDKERQAEDVATKEPGKTTAPPEAVKAPKTAEGEQQGGGPAIVDDEKVKDAAENPQTLGTVESAAKEEKAREREPMAPIRQDAAVLQDSRIALNYLQILEHFIGRTITAEDRAAAADGLSQAELDNIVAGAPVRRMLTALYTQGYREFEAAGGKDPDAFFKLEEAIVEQFIRGNPTATRNGLKIGHGIPEKDILGIVDRGSGFLLYDDNGFPLPGIGGVGMRDKGHIGSRQDGGFGINIAKIEDVGLRTLLNALRQTFSDPTRMTLEAANKLYDNLEQVKSEVEKGLSAEIKKQLKEGLPYFIGFLAGHGLSNFLMRSPNPVMIGIGLALQGLLRAAEYIMSIDAAAGAMEVLNKAAYHISRIEVDEQGRLSALSEGHIKAAADPIRGMVAEIAITVGTLALGRLIGAARRGKRTLRIECTTCTLKEPTPGAKAEPAPKAGEPGTPVETPKAAEIPKGAETPKAAETPRAGETPRTAEAPRVTETPPASELPKAPEPGKAPEPPAPAEPPPAIKEKMSAQQKERLRLEQELSENRARRKEIEDTVSREFEARTRAHNDLWTEKKKSQASPEKVSELERKYREATERWEEARRQLDEVASEKGTREKLESVNKEIEKTEILLNPKDHRAALPCFSGDTPVWTAQGARRIDTLRAGERIYAFDFAQERLVKRRIVEVFENKTQHFYDLSVGGEMIHATGRHRFWVEDRSGWVAARDLRPNVQLRLIDGRTAALDEISLRENLESNTYNLSVEGASNYFVGPGVLVHNQGVDLGLGDVHIIYRGTNKDFPGKVYIGQTTVLDADGKPRGTSKRQGEHRDFARDQLRLHREGKIKLPSNQLEFYRFMSGVELEPIVRGIATLDQANFLEQHNMDIERRLAGEEGSKLLRGKGTLMNRKEQIKSEGHVKEVSERIMKDPKVQAAGYCPR